MASGVVPNSTALDRNRATAPRDQIIRKKVPAKTAIGPKFGRIRQNKPVNTNVAIANGRVMASANAAGTATGPPPKTKAAAKPPNATRGSTTAAVRVLTVFPLNRGRTRLQVRRVLPGLLKKCAGRSSMGSS